MKVTIMAIISLFFLSGCGAVQLSPLANEEMAVQSVKITSKSIEVPEGMVFYDSSPPTRGIRFPVGIYALEAENEEYYYFRAPAPLDMRIFNENRMTDGRNIPGGLMLGKTRFKLVPAGGYIDGSAGKKVLIWKLGQEFLEQENDAWKKRFE